MTVRRICASVVAITSLAGAGVAIASPRTSSGAEPPTLRAIKAAVQGVVNPGTAAPAGEDSLVGSGDLGSTYLGAGPVVIDAHKAAGAADNTATGTFDGNVLLRVNGESTGVSVLHLAGPVDCLDVQGGSAGLIYPITAATPSALVGQAVRITVSNLGVAGEQAIGFVGPAPEALLGGCAPLVGTIPIAEPNAFTITQG